MPREIFTIRYGNEEFDVEANSPEEALAHVKKTTQPTQNVPPPPSQRGEDFVRPEEQQENATFAGIKGAVKEMSAMPIEAVNQAAFGIPKYLVNKIGGEGTYIEPETTMGKVGQVVGGLAGFAIGAPAKIATKVGTKLLGKTAQGLKAMAKKGAVEGAVIGALETPQSAQETGQGFLNPEERAGQALGYGLTGAAIPAAINVAGKALTKPFEWSKQAAESIISTSLKMKKSDRVKFLKDNYAKEDASSWMIDRIKPGTHDDIIAQLQDVKNQSYKTLNDSISNIPGVIKDTTNTNVLNKLRKIFNKNEALTPQDQSKTNLINNLFEKSKNQGLTVSENLQVKRLIDDYMSPFKPMGDLKQGLEWERLAGARNHIKSLIEKRAADAGVTNVKELSKDIQLSTLLSKSMIEGGTAGKSNRILSLTDFILGGGALTINPATAATVILAKKILESTPVKSNIAKILRMLSGDELKQFEIYRSKGIPPIGGKPLKAYQTIVKYIKSVGEKINEKSGNIYNEALGKDFVLSGQPYEIKTISGNQPSGYSKSKGIKQPVQMANKEPWEMTKKD